MNPPENILYNMEYFQFCINILKKEEERFNVKFDSTDIAQLISRSVNFDMVYNRCAYMYKHATCILHFVHDCCNKFLSECESFDEVVSRWISSSNLKLSSLSTGPGLEFIALMLAFSGFDCFKKYSLFKSVKIISKYGAWRNTLNLMLEAIVEGRLSNLSPVMIDKNNIEVIQGDPFIMFNQRIKDVVRDSDVVLMVKTLNLTAPATENDKTFSSALMELFAEMKPEAILFCIDTKPSCTLTIECLSKFVGKFLFGPRYVSGRLLATFPESYKEAYGHWPTLSARGSFFVWKKLSEESLIQDIVSPYKDNLLVHCAFHPSDSNFCNVSVSSDSSVINEQLDEDKSVIKSYDRGILDKSVAKIECDNLESDQIVKQKPSLHSQKKETLTALPVSNSTLNFESASFDVSPSLENYQVAYKDAFKAYKEVLLSENQNSFVENISMQKLSDGLKNTLNITQDSNRVSCTTGSQNCFSLKNGFTPECESVKKKKEKIIKEPKMNLQTYSSKFKDQSVQACLRVNDKENKSEIKSLISRIQMLTSSFEECLMQRNDSSNVKRTCNEKTEAHYCHKINQGSTSECRIHNDGASCFKYSSHQCYDSKCCFNNASTCCNVLQQKMLNAVCCNAKHFTHHFFGSKCNGVHSDMWSRPVYCNSSHVSASCGISSQSPKENSISSLVPNIVIPLENVESDVLCQIISLLKKT